MQEVGGKNEMVEGITWRWCISVRDIPSSLRSWVQRRGAAGKKEHALILVEVGLM
jgi:hypothetical protein